MSKKTRSLIETFWTWLHSNSLQLQALSSVAQIIGFVFVIIGIFLTYGQLRLGANQLKLTADQVKAAVAQTQGTIIQETSKTSRELFMRVWDDPNLRHLLDSSVKNRDPSKQDAFIGILINHFATIFRQWKLDNIPHAYWEEVVRDARSFFKSSEVQKKWVRVKSLYKEDFQQFVEQL